MTNYEKFISVFGVPYTEFVQNIRWGDEYKKVKKYRAWVSEWRFTPRGFETIPIYVYAHGMNDARKTAKEELKKRAIYKCFLNTDIPVYKLNVVEATEEMEDE